MYKYNYRPGYGSEDLLIEIYSGPEQKDFFSHLLAALNCLNIQIKKINDLWINNEVLISVKSDFGNFLISKDIYDLVFIISENNPSCLEKIDTVLHDNPMFEKVFVNFEDYK